MAVELVEHEVMGHAPREQKSYTQRVDVEGLKESTEDPAERFVTVPNRAAKRRARFGGMRLVVPGVHGQPELNTKPNRSRIQRGKSGESFRGQIVARGFDSYVDGGPDSMRGRAA